MKRRLLVDTSVGNANLVKRCSFNRIKLSIRKENNRRRGAITMHEVRSLRKFTGMLKLSTCIAEPVR